MGNDPIDLVAAELTAASTVAVAGHVGPDGDALGSMVALARAARTAGKDAVATFGEPFVVPHQLRFLDRDVLVPVAKVTGDLDLLVVVDCGDRDRLGSADVLADRAKRVAVIDHHVTNSGFGDVTWVDGTAAATAQMVHAVIKRLGWDIDKATAEAIYAGIVTDTGRFQYSSTSPSTHVAAADLLEAGVAPEIVGQRLYEESPFGYLRVAGAVLSRAQLDEEHELVWSILTVQDLKEAGISYDQADGLIDLIRIAEESQVAALFRDLGDGRTKASLRSRGAVDVGALAVAFGGGGHRNAAGFTAQDTPDRVAEQVRAALAEVDG